MVACDWGSTRYWSGRPESLRNLFNCAISVRRSGCLVADETAFAGIGVPWEAAACAVAGSAVEAATAASTVVAVLPAGKTLPLGAENAIDSGAWLPCTMLATDASTG